MKYSPKMVEKIAGYIRLGMRNIDAARLAGVDETTFYDWKRSKPQFSQALKESEDQGEASNLAVIQKAKNKQWTAAAWLLERRHPDKYSSRRELTGPGGKPIPVAQTTRHDVKGLSKDQLKALAKLKTESKPSAAESKPPKSH